MNLPEYHNLHLNIANSLADDIKRAAQTFGPKDPIINLYMRCFMYHKDRAQVSYTLNMLAEDDVFLIKDEK